MLNKVRVALVGALLVLPHIASAADEPTGGCVDVSAPKRVIMARHGKWTDLTPAQWQFLRGVYIMNPNTPPGLPYGDRAVLAQLEGNPGALVFFIDGQLACTPMAIPESLLSIVQSVATAGVNHVGTGL